jgi:hypothetical protein
MTENDQKRFVPISGKVGEDKTRNNRGRAQQKTLNPRKIDLKRRQGKKFLRKLENTREIAKESKSPYQ